jgi:hypothetical protein
MIGSQLLNTFDGLSRCTPHASARVENLGQSGVAVAICAKAELSLQPARPLHNPLEIAEIPRK